MKETCCIAENWKMLSCEDAGFDLDSEESPWSGGLGVEDMQTD